MVDKLAELLQETENNLISLYNFSFKYGVEETQNEEPYLEAEETVCELTEKRKQISSALAPFEIADDMEGLTEVYKQTFQNGESNKKRKIKNLKQLKDFVSKLNAIKAQAKMAGIKTTPVNKIIESEEFVMESDINMFDPLTKLQMKDPVKNRICGHHYEQSSIIEAIAMNQRLRCPVAGCGNQNFVKKADLIPDFEFKTRLFEALANESLNNA